jgi:hypothetical protein
VNRRQYAFNPPVDDPRHAADLLWDEMRDELEIARSGLEQSEAREVAQGALIDMLRKEIETAAESQARDRTAIIRMEAKLKAAGMLILDALKDRPEEEEERPRPSKRTLQDLPPARREPPEPQPSPSSALLPEVEDEQASARDVVSSIHKLANRWP